MFVAWDSGVNFITVPFWLILEPFLPGKLPEVGVARIRGVVSWRQQLEMETQPSPLLRARSFWHHHLWIYHLRIITHLCIWSALRKGHLGEKCYLFEKFKGIKFRKLLKENDGFLPHRSWSENVICLVSPHTLYPLWLQGDAVTFLTGKCDDNIILSFSFRRCLACRVEASSCVLRIVRLGFRGGSLLLVPLP